ncbi:unnamed protein product, partial [Candidula unifasciata]
VVCKRANVDIRKRAGELSEEEVERIVTVMTNPRQYKIPDWRFTRVLSNVLDNKLREDLELLKKKSVGRHTKTTGRRGRTEGMAKKK